MISQKPPSIPSELDHIAMMSRINQANRRDSEPLVAKRTTDLKVFGAALSAIYQASTCHRKCWGGSHVLEMIGVRIYNLSCAAYSLISIGYYDEAMNLTRGVGEAANLVALSINNRTKFSEWLRSSKQDRLNKFSPAKVRRLIGDGNPFLMMDSAQYGDLSQAYTHITPRMAPNQHNEAGRMMAGGIVQEVGVAKALDHLVYLVGTVALFYCRYFRLYDMFDEIESLTEAATVAPVSTAEKPVDGDATNEEK